MSDLLLVNSLFLRIVANGFSAAMIESGCAKDLDQSRVTWHVLPAGQAAELIRLSHGSALAVGWAPVHPGHACRQGTTARHGPGRPAPGLSGTARSSPGGWIGAPQAFDPPGVAVGSPGEDLAQAAPMVFLSDDPGRSCVAKDEGRMINRSLEVGCLAYVLARRLPSGCGYR